MANFKIYPGSFIKVMAPINGLEVGKTYQVINIRYFLTFVGIDGKFPFSGPWAPAE